MRRVLMVSPHFPPDTSAGTHRVRLLAPHLLAFGWEPTVVTVDPTFYEGRLDPDLAGLVPPSLRVLRAPAWSPRFTRPFGLGDLGLRALTGLARLCRGLLARERFDALFITVYPTYPAVLGPRLKAQYKLPFVLDYQDPWVGAWGEVVGGAADGSADLKSRLTRALAVRLEPRVVRHADALTAVSALTYEDVLARVPDARPRACAAIPLGYEVADVEAVRREPRPNPWFAADDGRIHVCYVGTVLPTGLPVLRAVLEALRALKQRSSPACARLRLHFLGTSNQRDPASPERVMPLARELGVTDMVNEVPPRLDYLDALNVQMQASAMLLMGSTEPHYTPSKVFPALLSGRPLVAVYHEQSSVVDLLRSPGVNARVTTFADGSMAAVMPALASTFEQIAMQPLAPSRPAPPAVIEPWSARSLAGRLGEILDTVARGHDQRAVA
jgi:glycosyltransferase involved in cell wall biosynthesis